MIYDTELINTGKNSQYWLIYQNIEPGQSVLDVGCATGYLGEYLKNNLNVNIVGLDYQDYHLKKAKERNVYSNLIKIDLNTFKNELNEYINHFDRIVLCDILEHLYDPVNVLKKLSKLLKSDGEFLIDIPNISHGSIKYNLLLNKFTYTSVGLLDNTHIRFYTPKSIIDTLSKNNFYIKEMNYIYKSPSESYGQKLNYEEYPQEIIDYIENDPVSHVFQIFLTVKKSNLTKDNLITHNNKFKKIKQQNIQNKELYVSSSNQLISLKGIIENKNKNIKEQKKIVEKQKQTIHTQKQTIKNKNNAIRKIKNSNSWKIMSPFRKIGRYLKKI